MKEDDPDGMIRINARDLMGLLAANKHADAQATELQRTGTRLLTENRVLKRWVLSTVKIAASWDDALEKELQLRVQDYLR